MSLIVTIATTNTPIVTIGATRVSGTGSRPDDVNTYRVDKRQFGATTPVGNVEHRYGDGAFVLARKMIDATEGAHIPRRSHQFSAESTDQDPELSRDMGLLVDSFWEES